MKRGNLSPCPRLAFRAVVVGGGESDLDACDCDLRVAACESTRGRGRGRTLALAVGACDLGTATNWDFQRMDGRQTRRPRRIFLHAGTIDMRLAASDPRAARRRSRGAFRLGGLARLSGSRSWVDLPTCPFLPALRASARGLGQWRMQKRVKREGSDAGGGGRTPTGRAASPEGVAKRALGGRPVAAALALAAGGLRCQLGCEGSLLG